MGSFNASLKTIGDTRGIPATVELREGRLSITAGEAEIGTWALDDVGLEPTPTGYRLVAEGDQVLLDMSNREQFAEELHASSKKSLGGGIKKKMALFSRNGKNADSTEADPGSPPEEPKAPEQDNDRRLAGEPTSRIPAALLGSSTPTKAPSNEPDRQPQPATASATSVETERPGFSARLVAILDKAIDATEKRWGSLLPDWVFNRVVFVTGLLLVALAFVFRGATSIVLLVAGIVVLMIGGAVYTDDVMASKLLPGRTTPSHVLIAGIGLLGVGIVFGLFA